jgi:hypothetical protein
MRKVFILVSGFSPRFNHIPSVRISKLAKFLSKHFKVYVIGGLPKGVPINSEVDVGSAEIIEINGFPLNKSNLSGRVQGGPRRGFWLRAKIFFGPLLMLLFPLSSGGGIYYSRRAYIFEITKLIEKYGESEVVLLTSYNPWFVIRIGEYLKRRHRDLFWIADYRDLPFNNIVEPVTSLAIFRVFAKRFVELSDLTICVTREIAEAFKAIASEADKVLYYPNGFDSDDLNFSAQDLEGGGGISLGKLVISYTGRFYQNGTRELEPFVAALACAVLNGGLDFVFRYAGSQAEYVKRVFSEFGLSENLEVLGVISRGEALAVQRSSDALLLISYTGDNDAQGDGIVTGKFFEYALTRKPIIVIGSHGWELRHVLLNDSKNALIRYSNTTEISSHLLSLFHFKRTGGQLLVKYNNDDLRKFDHEFLAKDLSGMLKLS